MTRTPVSETMICSPRDANSVRNDAFDRHPPVAFAQPREDRVLDSIERGEIDMAALGRLDAVFAR